MFYWSELFTSLIRFWQPQFDGLTRLTLTPLDFTTDLRHCGLVTLTFDLLTLKVVFESRVTWVTSVPILVFLGLSVPDLGPMYATDRRQTSDIA